MKLQVGTRLELYEVVSSQAPVSLPRHLWVVGYSHGRTSSRIAVEQLKKETVKRRGPFFGLRIVGRNQLRSVGALVVTKLKK